MKLKNRDIKKPLQGMTIAWIADECGVSVELLKKLAENTDVMYNPTRKEPKKGGCGFREIDPPKKQYKRLMRKIAKALSFNIKHHPAAHGGIPGRSSFTSARAHCGARFVATRDIHNCYPSIKTQQLLVAFVKLGASLEFARFLSSVVTVHNRIPQGGPCSSLALNLYLLRMDDHFYERAKNKGFNYGRLADDFVISSNARENVMALANELDHSIIQRNLEINKNKLIKKGFLGGDKLKEIHSLIINSPRGLKPKAAHVKKGLKTAELYARCCRCAQIEDIPYLADLRQQVTGWMYYFRQADFSPASHMKQILDRADDKVLRMLKYKGLKPHKNKWWLVSDTRNEPERLLRQWDLKKCLCLINGKKSA